MIKSFVERFTDKEIGDIHKIGRKYYLAEKELADTAKKISMKAESIGLFLGEEKKDSFTPSLALLEILSRETKKKIFIDDKSSWLFLCGRDVMAKSILRANVEKGTVLVQNEKDENLGMGKIVGNVRMKNDRIVVKNIIDKGDYLRREMDR